MNSKLEKLGYKLYEQPKNEIYKVNNLYEKLIDNKKVCETNNVLSIHIKEYQFINKPYLYSFDTYTELQYEISIRIEQKGFWWNLSCYSISEKDLINKLTEIENTLIKMVEII